MNKLKFNFNCSFTCSILRVNHVLFWSVPYLLFIKKDEAIIFLSYVPELY